jgi:hypothetical protein
MPAPVGAYGRPWRGPVGQQRGTGLAILLFIVTLGIYGLYWYFVVHDEMKRHRNAGLGGLVALLLALFVGFVMPFFTSDEVGSLYRERGEQPPVTAITGLWILLPIVGGLIWFIKTNGALNEYWRSASAAL